MSLPQLLSFYSFKISAFQKNKKKRKKEKTIRNLLEIPTFLALILVITKLWIIVKISICNHPSSTPKQNQPTVYLIEARGHDSLMWGSGSSELASPQTIFMTFSLLYNNHLQNFIVYFYFATSITKREKKAHFFCTHIKNYYFLYYLRSEAAAAFIVSIFRKFIFSSRNIDFFFNVMSLGHATPYVIDFSIFIDQIKS